ncbi:MAG: Rho-binding antiterminator [Chitinophagales bacterium]|nr:Rho-binding antiterminator [Chitinophagales bacterium]
MSQEYKPINCSYYDRLEDWATRKYPLTITFGEEQSTLGIIADLYVRDHVEYLKLEDGTEIRLDEILTINDEVMSYDMPK